MDKVIYHGMIILACLVLSIILVVSPVVFDMYVKSTRATRKNEAMEERNKAMEQRLEKVIQQLEEKERNDTKRIRDSD
jgi:type II secretory pathway component PulJ